MRFKSREISGLEFVLWTFIWGGLVTVIIASTTVFKITKSLGTGRPIDVIVYASIILLFYLIFRTYTKLENIERSITKITREIAYDKKETRSRNERAVARMIKSLTSELRLVKNWLSIL